MTNLSYSCILGRSLERVVDFFCCHSSCRFECFWQLLPRRWTKLLRVLDQKSEVASSTVTQKKALVVHITATGRGWTVDVDDGQALEYITMGHSTEEDGCTRPPSNSFLIFAVILATAAAMVEYRGGCVVASLLEKDGIGKEHYCAFDVTEHFHVGREWCQQRMAVDGSSSLYHLQRARNLNFSVCVSCYMSA